MERSESLVHLATALSEAQAVMPKATKDQVNPFFKSKYAGLDTVMPAALEVLSKHGLSIAQMPSHIDGHSALTTVLMHTSGEFLAAHQPLLLSKDDPQGQGAAITYARRYALMAAIGMVADEDDDGNAASQNGRTSSGETLKGAGPRKPGFEGWIPDKDGAKFAGECYICGDKYAQGAAVYYRKLSDGKWVRRHAEDCGGERMPNPTLEDGVPEPEYSA